MSRSNWSSLPGEAPLSEVLAHLEELDWLPGHLERLRSLSEIGQRLLPRREPTCYRVGGEGAPEYLVCLLTSDNSAVTTLLCAARAAQAAVLEARLSGGSKVFSMWEVVGPVVDAIISAQSLSRPMGAVVGLDPSTGRYFAHLLPEFASQILWEARRTTGITPGLVRAAMGFEEHYKGGGLPLQRLVRVQGDLVLEVLWRGDDWLETVNMAGNITLANDTADRFPQALGSVVERVLESIEELQAAGEEGEPVEEAMIPVSLPEQGRSKGRGEVGLSLIMRPTITGGGVRAYARLTIGGGLAVTYRPGVACDPLRGECDGPDDMASSIIGLMLAELLGGAQALYYSQATYAMLGSWGNGRVLAVQGPGMVEAAYVLARRAASKSLEKRVGGPTGLILEVGNHRIKGEGLLLNVPHALLHSSILKAARLAVNAAGSEGVDALVGLALAVSLPKTGEPVLAVRDTLRVEHPEHGAIEIPLGPSLVRVSMLNSPAVRGER